MFPTTPVPLKTPPTGDPTKFTQGDPEHNGPIGVIVGIICRMNTLRVTGKL